MAEHERDSHRNLEALAQATNDLRPTNDFVEAVMATLKEPSATGVLDKAARETASLEPSDDFVSAVMQSLGQGTAVKPITEPSWQASIVRVSRFALMGAAAAAALALYLSSEAQSSFDAVILSDVASLEVDE